MIKTPWILRLPANVRNNPAWIAIGAIFLITGVSFLAGFSDPSSISSKLPGGALNVWGALLASSGCSLIWATLRLNLLLERFTLRTLTWLCIGYAGWAVSAVGVSRATGVCLLSAALSSVFIVRAAVINLILDPPRNDNG